MLELLIWLFFSVDINVVIKVFCDRVTLFFKFEDEVMLQYKELENLILEYEINEEKKINYEDFIINKSEEISKIDEKAAYIRDTFFKKQSSSSSEEIYEEKSWVYTNPDDYLVLRYNLTADDYYEVSTNDDDLEDFSL